MIFFRQFWRTCYWFPRDLALWLRLGRPRKLIYFGGKGYGDTLLLGSVAHELHRRGIRTAILTDHPDLLRGNPAVSGVLPLHCWRALAAVDRFGGSASHLPYFLRPRPPTHDEPPDHHILIEMCRRAGVRGEIALRTYLHLEPGERAAGMLRPRQAAVQALDSRSENLAPLKIYPADRLAEVVRSTANKLDWIQIGGPNDPLLPCTVDLRGKTTTRQSAAILAASRVFLGPAGFLMHAARAVDCRSVIVFGGRELPRHGGYACNENFFSMRACSPCYRRSECLHPTMECMDSITPRALAAGVRRAVIQFGSPIHAEFVTVPEVATPFKLPWESPVK